jgi:biopolymer transport protein ExbD
MKKKVKKKEQFLFTPLRATAALQIIGEEYDRKKASLYYGAVLLIAIVLVVIIAVVAIVAVSCGGGEGQGTIGGGQSQEKGEKASYTVSIKSQGGMALSDIDVAIYADEKLTDMQDYAKTNENGIVNFQLVKDREYYIALSGAPKGYNVDL